jgi:coenzyme F420-0:L-glutamate ligase / coenzyme F420-1:gamma-L-glutamate ligase
MHLTKAQPDTRSRLLVVPIRSERKSRKFDLAAVVQRSLKRSGLTLRGGDVLVVSSKFAAMAEGNYRKLANLKISGKASKLSRKYSIEPGLAELIVRESSDILGGIKGYALAVTKGIVAPNAGIDRSNVARGYAILYPRDPEETAGRLRKKLIISMPHEKQKLGVILSDSRVTPGRLGTIGVAIAASGIETVVDERGKRDLFGNVLKVTMKAVADQLATAAELVMGEARESIPLVLIRGWNGNFNEDKVSMPMVIPFERCLYIRGLKNPFKSK